MSVDEALRRRSRSAFHVLVVSSNELTNSNLCDWGPRAHFESEKSGSRCGRFLLALDNHLHEGMGEKARSDKLFCFGRTRGSLRRKLRTTLSARDDTAGSLGKSRNSEP